MTKLYSYCYKIISQIQKQLSDKEVCLKIEVDLSEKQWSKYFSKELYCVSCYNVEFRKSSKDTKINKILGRCM